MPYFQDCTGEGRLSRGEEEVFLLAGLRTVAKIKWDKFHFRFGSIRGENSGSGRWGESRVSVENKGGDTWGYVGGQQARSEP